MKVNGHYYRDVLLSHQMIPAIKQVAGDMFVFQQDSAPAHRARDTIHLLHSALEALCDYALYKSTFTLHYIT